MNFLLTLVLVSISVIFFVTVLWEIRHEKLHIADSIFWMGLSVLFLLISIFPKIVNRVSDILGITGTQNLVFLVVIGVILLKVFNLSLKLSLMEDKMKTLSQVVAIEEFLEEENKVVTHETDCKKEARE